MNSAGKKKDQTKKSVQATHIFDIRRKKKIYLFFH
jgi:hypothetical protein